MNSEIKAYFPAKAKAVKLPSGVKWLQPFCVPPLKERARNNLNNLLPLPQGEGWGEGIKCSSYFMRVPKWTAQQAAYDLWQVRQTGASTVQRAMMPH